MYSGPDTPDYKAWHIIGDILFWVLRARRDPPLRSGRIEALWEQLMGDAPLAAADALYSLNHGIALIYHHSWQEFDLTAQCPRAAKSLLELSLKNWKSLTSIFRWGGSHNEAVVQFVIETLGRIGDEGTIDLLRQISDDPRLGAHAIAAIQKIRESARASAGGAPLTW
ncbi:MAG: hypothetical protein DMG35_01655 [Acidobacteria bacterium]|nr:MAG: hypothetical protein AUH86_14955 [Acidobacteria bacterium 13_1_40CM_4_58_4]PYT64090.1 MAG: hypothetical protein DMG35_01655 [Acidobacteriota bacterium]